jgi:hypothetical protein
VVSRGPCMSVDGGHPVSAERYFAR